MHTTAGLGIFTGIELEAGDAVAEPDIVVPLADFEWHSLPDMDFDFLWYDYSWQAGEVGMDFDMDDGTALVIGTGCMPNCNFALINAHEGQVRSKILCVSMSLFLGKLLHFF